MTPTLWSRLKRRMGFKATATRNAFAGAAASRLNDFVYQTIQSANQELRFDLWRLRGRARDLARNNPAARRFLAMLAQNVVGHRGIQLEVQATLKTGPNAGNPDDVANDKIEAAWRAWGKPGQCDVTRTLSFVALQSLALQTVARDGECFIRVIEGYANDTGFALQVLDADQVDETYNVPPADGQNRVDMGIESDAWGAPVTYWLWTRHPQEAGGTRKRIPIPARDMIHLHLVRRMGQARGETWFAPVLVPIRMLAGYQEAELVAARTAASKMGFIKPGPDATGPDPEALPGQTQTMQAEPGSIERLGVDEDFVPWSPEHPAGNFGPFTLSVLRDIASGLNVSYMGLTGDLTSANYSSARVGLLDERDGYRLLQQWLADHLHDVVYRRWLRMAAVSPKVNLPIADFAKYEQVCWRPRGFPWVDPLKDLEAAALAVDRGFDSPTNIVAENGDELEDIYRGIAKAKKLASVYGIELSTGINPRPAVDKVGGQSEPGTPAGNTPGGPEGAAQKGFTEALTRIADSTHETTAAVKWIAGKEYPTPVFNIDARTTVAPQHITVEPSPVTVTVEAPARGERKTVVIDRDGTGQVTGATVEEAA